MNPVGRKESLDALHQAQKLQAVLQELLAWARSLRAEMNVRSTPGSLEEVRLRLEEHQESKVRGPDPGASPRISPCLWPSLTVVLVFSRVLSAVAPSACLFFHPSPSPVFPAAPPSHVASPLPLREPLPLGSEPSPLTGRAGLPQRQHQPGPKHWAATACHWAPIHPRHPPGPSWFRPGVEQPGTGLA